MGWKGRGGEGEDEGVGFVPFILFKKKVDVFQYDTICYCNTVSRKNVDIVV